MKKLFISIISTSLAILFVFTFVSCSSSAMSDIEKEMRKMEDDGDIYFQRFSKEQRENIIEVIEKEMYEKVKGDIVEGYYAFDDEDYDLGCVVIEFEKKNDAKLAYKALGEYYGDDDAFDDFYIIRDGKVVICGVEKLVQNLMGK